MEHHEIYMRRALELAAWGAGTVSPNPLVGCVIVRDGRIIGEGYHAVYGGPHAEPNAVAAVEDSALLEGSSVYVTLEPCAHYGKTPPCADLLVAKKVKEVIIAAKDSNPLVGGKGIAILQAAGISVITGILEQEARWQNRRFFTAMEKKRPYLILKWAQTRDGYVARPNYDSKWISNPLSRQLVHRWRSEEDAILVGTKTAHYDNPKLNVRDWAGRDPVRIVIDKHLTLDPNSFLFDQSQPTLCYNLVKSEASDNLEFVQMKQDFSLENLLTDLHNRKIQSLIIEGGGHLLQQFISRELWDEARVFTGNIEFGAGIPAPKTDRLPFETRSIQDDRLDLFLHSALVSPPAPHTL
ncbi:MAG: bifunctional diaminohydroxyphosphoribosylaminopyrimidine deaminase/5-amino-6-(5-phosphoribosylamino)uracil reductase RibD [Lunatimonas sp.]|uniref:bifunctional diaminohydroxyphosphoribosylaminopyrimidine deaminase/5-amino-6-(5-phosphoribosylamino)uracil reductase RibD n=1 Tax=Lunatimonas sp. TaxID=2060141 RepID=UPI00263BC3EA|nr:bifunctional diaminohydroxyphosphoribosylaminopyrimidine deaminase/5-amino-6-(5-phosphoribosylamino)uracil reductase RibD [Lunatimonas sp.]MCC5938133.1 bifunctional diaminohydroxyphosphoribosylaminopyrimidine deaminase/5-amino-6-(5-phosphoribosylamino)uracil reductase RibD [Lunatimonas sp.]